MVKAIMPIAVGAVLGASIISVLLKSDGTSNQSTAAIVTAEPISAPAAQTPVISSEFDRANGGDAEFSQLALITNPVARREVALALLDVRGYSAANIDEVAATLPLIEAVFFRIDAIVALGQQDVHGALTAAMLLSEPEQRRLALRRLAQSFAENDPLGALSSLDAIDSAALESEFMVALLDNWAITDPDQMLAFLANSSDIRIPSAEAAFDLLADHDPERLLDAADNFTPEIRGIAFTAALQSLIQQDAIAALSRIEQLPAGPDQSTLEYDVARAYGEQDPEAAWLWANESEATADRRLVVLAGIQSTDPDRALEMMMSELASADAGRRAEMRQRVGSYLFYLIESVDSVDVEFALDRLLATDSSLEPNIQQFIGNWANDDPEAALDWSLRNINRIQSDQALLNIGRSLARTNVDRARQALFQLPQDRQASWVAGVGRTLAEVDSDAARDWAFEFATGPLRDAALQEYARSEAHGGSIDQQLFDQFSSDDARDQAASQVASRLACDGHEALAAEIAATHIASQDLLRSTEAQVERNARGGPNSIICMINP